MKLDYHERANLHRTDPKVNARDRLIEALQTFTYEIDQVEWRRDGNGWVCTMRAATRSGEHVRGLVVRAMFPVAPNPDIRLGFSAFAMCPIWVEHRATTVTRFTLNTDSIGL